MKKFLSLFITLLMIISVTFAFTPNAFAYTGVVEKDGVMQMGDFENAVDGYIIYYPTDLAESDEAYPVAVWANGTMCAPALYNDLLVSVAKQGYIVIASSELMSKDGTGQIAAIDYILEKSMDESSPFFGKVDPNRIGAFGHSQGGASSVNAAVADNRIGAIVSIAGASTSSEAKGLTVPSLFLTGTMDTVVLSSLWVNPSYKACQGTAVYASLKGGVHTSCMLKAETYSNYIVKWFNAFLSEDGDKSAFTSNGELAKDSEWTDYKSKNMTANVTTSVFSSTDDIWFSIAAIEFAIIIACIVIIISKRKKPLKNEPNEK